MLGPNITSSREQERRDLERHVAVLAGEIVTPEAVQYEWVFSLFRAAETEPILVVTSELNVFGVGSHVLRIFLPEGQINLGASDEWGDRERFLDEALKIAAEEMARAHRPELPEGPRAPAPLRLTVQPIGSDGSMVLVDVVGEIVRANAEPLSRALSGLPSRGTRYALVDLEKVTRVDSMGWAMFISAAEGLRNAGGGLALLRLQDSLKVVIRFLSLDKVIPVCGSQPEAVRALRGL